MNISEEPVAITFRMGVKMETAGSSETSVNVSSITWHINPEDEQMNLHLCDKLQISNKIINLLKTGKMFCFLLCFMG
jgi:hypothetical protein